MIESGGVAIDVAELTALCRRELSPYKVPEIWSVVDALPVNAMGKVERTKLPALAARRPHSTQA